MKKNWIQKAKLKEGGLHKQLGIPAKESIPIYVLEPIVRNKIGSVIYVPWVGRVKVTKLLKRRAVLALNLKRMKGGKK